MTTAHRPTWAPAKGREEQGGARMFGPSRKHSKLDDNAHMTLKTRAPGQMSVKELMMRDFRAELEAKEAKHFGKKTKPSPLGDAADDASGGRLAAPPSPDDDDDPGGGPTFVPKDIDKDDSDSDSDSDLDSDEDDTAALLAELERVKSERAAEASRRAAEAAEAEAMERADELASGNPLLDLGRGGRGGDGDGDGAAADFSVKRRWDDDVVFKNQTRGEPERKKRFVNDTIRSDFHRRFLNKYIK